MVIIIAVVVGGLISGFCIGVIVYMSWKAIKKNRENEKALRNKDGREGILRDSPDNDEEDDDDSGPNFKGRRATRK